MKKFTTLMLFTLLTTAYSSAQTGHLDLNMAHNWNYLDRDLELSAERFFNKNGFKIGLHYFQNTAEQYLNWQDKPRATKFAEHLGWSAAYLRHVPVSESNIEFYPYLKLSGFNLRYQAQDEVLGIRSEPATWKFYSGVGIQIKSKLYRKLYLSASADAGAIWAKREGNIGGKVFNGIAPCGSVGLAYRIGE